MHGFCRVCIYVEIDPCEFIQYNKRYAEFTQFSAQKVTFMMGTLSCVNLKHCVMNPLKLKRTIWLHLRILVEGCAAITGKFLQFSISKVSKLE